MVLEVNSAECCELVMCNMQAEVSTIFCSMQMATATGETMTADGRPKYVLSVDIGSTSMRCFVVDAEAKFIASASQPVKFGMLCLEDLVSSFCAGMCFWSCLYGLATHTVSTRHSLLFSDVSHMLQIETQIPAQGHVELDPEVIWSSFVLVVKDAMKCEFALALVLWNMC